MRLGKSVGARNAVTTVICARALVAVGDGRLDVFAAIRLLVVARMMHDGGEWGETQSLRVVEAAC